MDQGIPGRDGVAADIIFTPPVQRPHPVASQRDRRKSTSHPPRKPLQYPIPFMLEERLLPPFSKVPVSKTLVTTSSGSSRPVLLNWPCSLPQSIDVLQPHMARLHSLGTL